MFTARTITHRKIIPRGGVESPQLDAFKMQLDRVTISFLSHKKLHQVIFGVPFQSGLDLRVQKVSYVSMWDCDASLLWVGAFLLLSNLRQNVIPHSPFHSVVKTWTGNSFSFGEAPALWGWTHKTQDQGEYWLTGRQDKPARQWEERAERSWEVTAHRTRSRWTGSAQDRTGQEGQQWRWQTEEQRSALHQVEMAEGSAVLRRGCGLVAWAGWAASRQQSDTCVQEAEVTRWRKQERLFEDLNRKSEWWEQSENRARPEHGWKHGDRRAGW